MQCFLLDPSVLRVEMGRAEVRLVATAHVLHQLGVNVLGRGHRRQVVCLRRRHQHALRFRQLVALVDRHVRLEVLNQIPCLHPLPINLLRDQILRPQQHRHQLLQAVLKLGRDVREPPVKRLVRGHRQARMRHQKAGNLRETARDVTPQRLQLRVLLLLHLHASLQQHLPAQRTVLGLVRKAPVAHQKLQPLERLLAAVGQRQPPVLGEELQRKYNLKKNPAKFQGKIKYLKMLQVVLLDVLGQVVDLYGREHRAEREHGRAVPHRALAVEGALRVQQDDGELAGRQ